MPAIEHAKTLFAYHFDTTGRLMDLAENLSESEYHENPGYGRGSIHDLLFHILNADHGWRVGLETGVRPPSLETNHHADLPSLRERLAQERAAWEAMLAGLTDEQLDVVVEVSAGPGRQLSSRAGSCCITFCSTACSITPRSPGFSPIRATLPATSTSSTICGISERCVELLVPGTEQ